ncbi:AMP-binding protein [Actinokineospora iranica]|uniref:AMP-binding protein n=1 Tax=Actinokineospora iranica TaxID=1271860 RepID=UPI000B848DB5|nr:AMP-binding protein [Actinokineospora iranica]
MSRIVTAMLTSGNRRDRGIVVGEPRAAERFAWSQVHERARRIAGALVGGGVPARATVAILAGEPAVIAPAVQAVWLAGGTVAMLHLPTSRTGLRTWSETTLEALRLVSADVVLIDRPFASFAAKLADVGIPFMMIADLTGKPLADVVPSGDDEPALLQLTSGSTAEPKAVVLTHANIHANVIAMLAATRTDVEREVFLSWLPLFHDMGMMGFLLLPMAFGADLVSVTPRDFLFHPLIWAELISKHRATVTAGPDFSYGLLGRELAAVPDGTYDLSSLRIALNGSDPIDPRSVDSFVTAGRRFGLAERVVLPAYGLAEATVAVSFSSPGTGLRLDAGLALLGPPLPGVEVRVSGEDGRECGDREVGELWIRGPSVSRRYLTVDGPVPTHRDQGWLPTGDLGYLADGEIVIRGRITDVITIGGRRVYPTDVERAAASVPGVRAGNVVALRLDEGARRERFAVAFESTLAGDAAEERRLCDEVAAAVVHAVSASPAAVIAVPPGALPKTSSGKLRRAAAKSRFVARLR